MANNQLKINRIAIWKPAANLKDGEINVSLQPAGLKYLPENSNVYQTATQPIYRYVKNYSVKKVKFSLFVRTFSDSKAAIEAELDKTAKEISEEFARRVVSDPDYLNFEYLDKFIKEEK